eukprot:gnl/TRDRNA2_/TRDRNA2_89337_c0_seq1.p1 gnl/TRDRNA2_/TRDRNA2_89337_c0~~gnl/TRDRNA2_/TRDRNA2_89337_c0_seq1.p1  ORF type:complete len:431 (+),score=41.44 gnl/TRDRNA2_/TRDRNA2_89337_c0_seq1:151-1293(+)
MGLKEHGEMHMGHDWGHLTDLAEDQAKMDFLCEVVRAYQYHPHRSQILNAEEHKEGAPSGELRKRATKGDLHDLIQAIDSHMLMHICHGDQTLGPLIAEHSDSSLPIMASLKEEEEADAVHPVTGTGKAMNRIRNYKKRHAAKPFQNRYGQTPEASEYMPLLVAYVWDAIDIDGTGTIRMEECRELLRTVLSRPLFGIAARNRIYSRMTPNDQNLFSRREALVACCSASQHFGIKADQVAGILMAALDPNGRGIISEYVFRGEWDKCICSLILDPVGQLALQRLKDHHATLTAPQSAAEVPSLFGAGPPSTAPSSQPPSEPQSGSTSRRPMTPREEPEEPDDNIFMCFTRRMCGTSCGMLRRGPTVAPTSASTRVSTAPM